MWIFKCLPFKYLVCRGLILFLSFRHHRFLLGQDLGLCRSTPVQVQWPALTECGEVQSVILIHTNPLMSDDSVTLTQWVAISQLTDLIIMSLDHSQLNISAISRGWRFRFAANLLDVVKRAVSTANLALEDLLVSLPEVLWQEGIDDRVDRWVAVRQAVCYHPKNEGGLVQWEGPKLHPKMNNVVREPGQAKNHHHYQHCLSCLGAKKEKKKEEMRDLVSGSQTL